MTAYYNEIDPFAAAWLRQLIDAGHIAPGVVDERSIEDVIPDELAGYTQCHFFAGIGVWSHALRQGGWPDDRQIWTGSCPCQPFSAAGKGAGFADERHVWPAFLHLIKHCRPPIVLGEQVASKDGLAWLDLVSSDVEGEGYAFGATDLCAAGVGAPHIRQRSYWVAHANNSEWRPDAPRRDECDGANTGRSQGSGDFERRGGSRVVGNAHDARLEGQRSGYQAQSGRVGEVRPVAATGKLSELGDTESDGPTNGPSHPRSGGPISSPAEPVVRVGDTGVSGQRHGPTNGFWRNADWLYCRDGKWRPVEPGTFPLVNGASARVGRLRGYGNAIVTQVAQTFIEAIMDGMVQNPINKK